MKKSPLNEVKNLINQKTSNKLKQTFLADLLEIKRQTQINAISKQTTTLNSDQLLLVVNLAIEGIKNIKNITEFINRQKKI